MTQAIATALDCPPEPEGKTLLLKTGHNLENRFGPMELELTWKPPSLKAALTALESSIQPAKGEQQLMVQHQL